MNVTDLQLLTDDLASYLSEVTQGDLARPVAPEGTDLGDLILRLIDQNLTVAEALRGTATSIPRTGWPSLADRAMLTTPPDLISGGGYEQAYRETARLMVHAFADAGDPAPTVHLAGTPGAITVAALLDRQGTKTLLRTWDVARIVGLPYAPDPEIAKDVLRTIVREVADTETSGASTDIDDPDVFGSVLRLAGRERLAS